MIERPKDYIPALSYDWLLPLYDPMSRWIMREDVFKRRLIAEAQIGAGDRVLDLGCGTGTLTLLIKRLHPDAEVCGLDGDPKALAIARRKTEAAGAHIQLDEGFSYALPYDDASFNRVVSSLVFHHLTRENKLRSLREVRRVLKPRGSLHIVDFGESATGLGARLAHWFHSGENLRDNIEGRLPQLMSEAGFTESAETGRHRVVVGSLSFYRGMKAAVGAPAT